MNFKPLITFHCLLFASFLFLFSCTPTPQPPQTITLYAFRITPPALIEFSPEYKPIKEIPLSFPPKCGLFNTFPAPRGSFMAIELSCPSGQTVLFLDTSTSLSAGSETGSTTQPVTDSDSHFLAWTSDGKAAYLKVDSTGNAHVIRAYLDGAKDIIPITELTYDLAPQPNSHDFTFTFSRGMGYGSELWLAKHDGRIVQQLYADQYNYLSFARWSPDGSQIAFIKTPDTQTPFTVGELWIMNADGSNPRKLADADTGHGYAANWSPDGKRIAFVVRENPNDERANQSAGALISNIYIVDIESGRLTQITNLESGRVETPLWSPDGNTLAFNTVLNGRIEARAADLVSGEIRFLGAEPACCPAWMRK